MGQFGNYSLNRLAVYFTQCIPILNTLHNSSEQIKQIALDYFAKLVQTGTASFSVLFLPWPSQH